MAKLLGLGLVISLLFMLQNYWAALEFDRQQILSGEVWRLWTGHFVHTNTSHLTLNIAAATLCYFAFFSKIKINELIFLSFIFSTLIGLALIFTCPGINWYNGLSGLLHAYVAFFCVRFAREENRVFWLGFLAVWMKVLLETIRAHFGHEYLRGSMVVITEAHFLGVFFGSVTAFFFSEGWRNQENTESVRNEVS